MLMEQIEKLRKAVERGEESLRSELEALRGIAQGIEGKNFPRESINQLSVESWEAVVKELMGRGELGLVLGLEEKLDKEKRRVLHKILHQLKSQGVKIPEKAEPKKVGFSSQLLKSWVKVTPVFSLKGEQVLYYFASGTMGTNFLMAQMGSEDGIQELVVLQLTENQARRVISNFRYYEGPVLPAVDISQEHFLWLIHQAKAKTKNQQKWTELEGFMERFRIQIQEQIDDIPPVYKMLDQEKVRSGFVLTYQIDLLLNHPFFQSWSFDQKTLNDCQKALKEAEEGLIVLTESQKMEQRLGIFRKFTELGIKENRSQIKFGLLENAYLLSLKGEGELAETAFRLALKLDQGYESLEFFQKILLRSFPHLWNTLGPKPSGLIIPAS